MSTTSTEPGPGPRPLRLLGAGGLTLAADEWGQPDHQTVLLLHGGGQTRHSWKKAGQALSRYGLHVVTLDLRGHGDSDWSAAGDYGVAVCAEDALGVMRQVGTPTVLVGASLGGLTSLMVVDLAPELVTALVLVDIVVRYQPEGADRIRDFMTGAPRGFASLQEAADAVAAYLPHRARPEAVHGLRKNLRWRDGRWHWHWDPAWFAPSVVEATNATMARLDEAARRVQVPTLLLHGAHSDIVNQEGVEHFRGLVPHAEVLELANAAHTAAADDNDAFVAAVVEMCRVHLDIAV
ncbi:MAG: alpha/beta fold hydrolase [Dermatophilaceae bacterium]